MTNYVTHTDTNKMIRKVLKEAFPDTKFSVKKSNSSTRVQWEDGPSIEAVKNITRNFEGASFDGMLDLETPQYGVHPETGERVHFHAKYIFLDRYFSVAGFTTLTTAICNHFGVDVPEIEVSSGGNAYFAGNSAMIDVCGQSLRERFWKWSKTFDFANVIEAEPEPLYEYSAPLLPAGAYDLQVDNRIEWIKRIRNTYAFNLRLAFEYSKGFRPLDKPTGTSYRDVNPDTYQEDDDYDDTEDRINQLREAQRLLRIAADTIREAMDTLDNEGAALAYLVPSIEMAIDNEHMYLGSCQFTVQDAIDELEES